MAKLIILRGLPASGKSTRARSWCEDPANTWPHCVISLDDIRLMIAGSAQVRNRLQSEHGKRFNGGCHGTAHDCRRIGCGVGCGGRCATR